MIYIYIYMAVRKKSTLYRSLYNSPCTTHLVVQGFVQGPVTLYKYGVLNAVSGRSSVEGLRTR